MTTPSQPDPMGGMVAGAADLQGSIDRLDRAMIGLTQAIQGMSNGNGTTTSPAMSSSFASQGVTFTNGSQVGTSYGAGLGSFGFGGSGGGGGTNPFSFAGGSLAQGAVNAVSSVVNGQFRLGAQSLNNQAIINTYGYTQAGFWNVSSQSAIGTAFGGGAGGNLRNNNLATSATDAYYGAQILSQVSGQANYTAPAGPVYGRGNAIYQAAATTGMANPGLGMANSASVSSAWYNPSTSYNLMMMGITNTPLSLGTGRANSMTGVEAAIGQRFGFQGFNSKTGTFNSQSLAANLDNPLFQMQIMQATGMTQQQYATWSQQWAQMNTWATAGHTTMNQMQNQISQYMNGSSSQQKSAQSWLASHGVSQSLLQSMTQANAGMTSTEAGSNSAFTKGVQAATSTVNQLTAAFSQAVEAMGGTAGFAGAVGSLNASGVSGAGGLGAANTVIGAIGAIVGTLGHINTDLAQQQRLLQSSANLSGVTSTGSGGASAGPGGHNNPSGGTGTGGNTGSTSIGGTAAGHQGSISNTGNDFTSVVNGSSPSSYGGNANKWRPYATSLFGQHGWAMSQWPYLAALWQAESGWNPNAYNNNGGATGIPQALPGSKMASAGPDWRTNGNTQIRWGEGYIAQVYGTPQKAWDHEVIHGWYADGTSSAKAGLALVGERGPELVALSGGQQIINAQQTAKMMQPAFGMPAGGGGAGLAIIFQSGSIVMHSSGNPTQGYHTSSDVQSSAGQLVQAVETALMKSALLKNIANGVTG